MLEELEKANTEVITCFIQIYLALVIGDARVGKTTLIRKLCNISTQNKILPTIGVQFASMTLRYQSVDYKLKFWDLSGQKKFSSLVNTYISRCNVVIIVFDLNNFESFHNAQEWILQLKSKHEDIIPLLFGNKKDIYDKNPNSGNILKLQVINDFCKQYNVIYEIGCGLCDSKLEEAIKKLIQKNFVPNQVILEGSNQQKSCSCFC